MLVLQRHHREIAAGPLQAVQHSGNGGIRSRKQDNVTEEETLMTQTRGTLHAMRFERQLLGSQKLRSREKSRLHGWRAGPLKTQERVFQAYAIGSARRDGR